MADHPTNGSNGGSFPEIRWQSLALCHGLTPLFFVKGRSDIARDDQERAKGLCRYCDVRTQCFEAAFSREEPEFGVWGGLTEEERRDLDHCIRKALAALGVASGSEDSSVLRRHLLSLFGAVFLDPEELSRILFGSTADAKMLSSLEKVTTGFYATFGTTPSGKLLVATQEQLRVVTGFLAHPQRLDRRQQLLATMAHLATLMGTVSFELHDQQASRDWYRTALYARREAGDSDICTLMLARQVYHATLSGNFVHVLKLAQEAEARADESVSASHHAYVYALQAQAYAVMGDVKACLVAFDHAESAMSRASPEERRPGPGLGHFDEAVLLADQGRCLTLLGKPQAAVPVLHKAIALQRATTLGSTLIHLYLGEAFMRQGEIEKPAKSLAKQYPFVPIGCDSSPLRVFAQ